MHRTGWTGTPLGDITSKFESATLPSREQIFSVFPNPAKKFLSIQFSITREEAQFEIYNVSGRRIQTIHLYNQSASHQSSSTRTISLDISSWENGVYFVRYKTPTLSRVQKLTILR